MPGIYPKPDLDNASVGNHVKINALDIAGAGLALTSTYYFTKAARFAWCLGIIAVVINIALYWQKGIFGHFILECIYFVSFIVGLWHWRPNSHTKQIKKLTFKQILLLSSVSLVFIILIALLLNYFTKSSVANLDAITTVLSLVAQTLLIYKYIQCWVVWLVVDVIVAYIQFDQGMPFHGVSTTLYCGMALLGYYRWSKLLSPSDESVIGDTLVKSGS